MGGNIEFRDTAEASDFQVIFPKGITNIRIGIESSSRDAVTVFGNDLFKLFFLGFLHY